MRHTKTKEQHAMATGRPTPSIARTRTSSSSRLHAPCRTRRTRVQHTQCHTRACTKYTSDAVPCPSHTPSSGSGSAPCTTAAGPATGHTRARYIRSRGPASAAKDSPESDSHRPLPARCASISIGPQSAQRPRAGARPVPMREPHARPHAARAEHNTRKDLQNHALRSTCPQRGAARTMRAHPPQKHATNCSRATALASSGVQ